MKLYIFKYIIYYFIKIYINMLYYVKFVKKIVPIFYYYKYKNDSIRVNKKVNIIYHINKILLKLLNLIE